MMQDFSTFLPLLSGFLFLFAACYCCCRTSPPPGNNGIPTVQPQPTAAQQQQQQIIPVVATAVAAAKPVIGEVVKFKNWVVVDCKEEVDLEKGGGGRSHDDKDCSICLEEFKGEHECMVLTVCGHIYHRYCIGLWLTKNNHCPVCRGSVRRGRGGRRAGNHIDRI